MNISTYLSKDELAALTKLSKSKYTNNSALIRQAINEFPRHILILPAVTKDKTIVAFTVESEKLHSKLESLKAKFGKSKSSIIYSLVLHLIDNKY